MELNPFADIVGLDFECVDTPPKQPSSCPAQGWSSGGLQRNDDTGEWWCPVCYAVVGTDSGEEDDFFDDDEDEGDAFDNDEDYVAEGDKPITFTPEQRLRNDRDTTIERIIDRLSEVNSKFAIYLDANRYTIVDYLRVLEVQGEPVFDGNTNLAPKVISVAMHLSKLPLDDSQVRLAGATPTRVRMMLNVLNTLKANDSTRSPIVEKMFYVGNAVGVSDQVVSLIAEQYEAAGAPPNRVPDDTTRAAAWLHIQASNAGIRVTKSALKKVPGVRQNALDRAVDSYKDFLSNSNKAVERVE